MRIRFLCLAGICCALFSDPVNAGFVASSGSSPDENTASPMSNGWELASFGPGFTGSRTSRTSSGGGSAGLLSESSRLLKPLVSNRRRRQEFQFIPDAPLFELLRPS